MSPLLSPRGLVARLTGRSHDRLRSALSHPGSVLRSIKGALAFRHPWSVLWCYVTRTSPPTQLLHTRSGFTMRLTGDEDDVVTALVVIGRREYGDVPRGVVIDVGAHLGAFVLYAMSEGAERVYAFEPDPQLYATLFANVQANHLAEHVRTVHAAVVGHPRVTVPFHREGNASGHVDSGAAAGIGGSGAETIQVRAVTLAQILTEEEIDRVDLLKLDCEGSEYEIVAGVPPETWRRIERVRLEYHHGRADQLRSTFEELGFSLVRATHTSALVGMLWFERSQWNG